MAKVRSIIDFSGTMGNFTFVNSKTYGKHVRAKRGTYKPAPVNGSFVESSRCLKHAVPYAKLINRAINEHHGLARDRKLWQRLVGRFRAAIAKSNSVNYHELKSLRISSNPLDRILTTENLSASFCQELKVDVSFHQPNFQRVTRVTGYRMSIIAVFVNSKELQATSHAISQDYEVAAEIACQSFAVSFSAPPPADTALVILKCEALRDGDLIANADAVGMNVIEVVDLV